MSATTDTGRRRPLGPRGHAYKSIQIWYRLAAEYTQDQIPTEPFRCRAQTARGAAGADPCTRTPRYAMPQTLCQLQPTHHSRLYNWHSSNQPESRGTGPRENLLRTVCGVIHRDEHAQVLARRLTRNGSASHEMPSKWRDLSRHERCRFVLKVA